MARKSLKLIKIHIWLFFGCTLLVIGWGIAVVVNSGDPMPANSLSAAHDRLRFVPIFATVDSASGTVAFANEDDLDLTATVGSAESRSQIPAEVLLADPEKKPPSSNQMVTFHQPDGYKKRLVPLANLTLEVDAVNRALQAGKDWSRVNNEHSLQVIKLPNGESAIWVAVRHVGRPTRYDSYWSGLIYVVRDAVPELLLTLKGADRFSLQDVNDDGFIDIVRTVRPFAVKNAGKGFVGSIYWDIYSWQKSTGVFEPVTNAQSFVPVADLVAQLLVIFPVLIGPFFLYALLALFFNVNWPGILLKLHGWTANPLLLLVTGMQVSGGPVANAFGVVMGSVVFCQLVCVQAGKLLLKAEKLGNGELLVGPIVEN